MAGERRDESGLLEKEKDKEGGIGIVSFGVSGTAELQVLSSGGKAAGG